MNLLKGLGAEATEIRVTGGGAKGDFWVQMLADMFNASCVILESDEGPALGAALLAGVGAGVWPDVEEACRATIRIRKRFSPSGADYSSIYTRYRDLYPAMRGWRGNFES
jgi:xylulokinase